MEWSLLDNDPFVAFLPRSQVCWHSRYHYSLRKTTGYVISADGISNTRVPRDEIDVNIITFVLLVQFFK